MPKKIEVGKMRKGMIWALFAYAFFLLFASEVNVKAGTTTATFQVTASVPSYACTVTTTTLGFGTYVPGSTSPTDIENSVGVNCNGYLNVAVYPNGGLNATHAAGTTRAMSNGGSTPNYLSYDIYTDTSYSKVWNSSNQVTFSVIPYTTYYAYGYGRIPTSQFVSSGNYSDTVTAIVNF